MEDLRYVVITILVVLLCLILFFEWRFMRSRFKKKRENTDLSDRAYNAVRTTESISDVLKHDGIDTSEAQPYITEAKAALSRHDYHFCIELAERAKSLLRKAKTQADLKPFDKFSEEQGIKKEGDEEVPPEPKLPENYMQSKFTISLAKDAIQRALRKGEDISKAQELLKKSTRAFENRDYSLALKLALRSKKCADGVEGGGGIVELSVHEGSKENKCPNCGENIKTGDIFCRKCGTKIEVQLSCSNCGEGVNVYDIFCGKCGAKLK